MLRGSFAESFCIFCCLFVAGHICWPLDWCQCSLVGCGAFQEWCRPILAQECSSVSFKEIGQKFQSLCCPEMGFASRIWFYFIRLSVPYQKKKKKHCEASSLLLSTNQSAKCVSNISVWLCLSSAWSQWSDLNLQFLVKFRFGVQSRWRHKSQFWYPKLRGTIVPGAGLSWFPFWRKLCEWRTRCASSARFLLFTMWPKFWRRKGSCTTGNFSRRWVCAHIFFHEKRLCLQMNVPNFDILLRAVL